MDVLCFYLISYVLMMAWMWKRTSRNWHCPSFVSWTSNCLCLHLLGMLGSSEWCHSFAWGSNLWIQGGSRNSTEKWGWCECPYRGNFWLRKGADSWKCMSGCWKCNARCKNGFGNGWLMDHWANGPWIGFRRFLFVSFDICAWDRIWWIMHVVWHVLLVATWVCALAMKVPGATYNSLQPCF